jgi:serpin B
VGGGDRGAAAGGGAAVELPRFELEWESSLLDALEALGVRTVFGGGADLTPMTPGGGFVGEVVHKSFVRVDEQGTEAAAVTGGIVLDSAPAREFTVDRPFAFTVSDAETGTVLFLGTVTDPRG